MESLQKPSVWAPLLGYVLLAGWALVFITGVAWLYPEDTNGKAIVDLRVYFVLGFTACVLFFSLLGKLKKYCKASVLGVAGSLLMCAGFLVTVVSMPSILESEYIHFVGSCCAGVGFGLVFMSSENFWHQFEPKLLTFLCCCALVVSLLLYFIINSCPQSVAIVLSVIIPCTAALVFSGFFFKSIYSGAFNFQGVASCQSQEDLDYSPDTATWQVGTVFFLLAVSVFSQQNYYLSSMLPLNIYSCFSISFVGMIIALAFLAAWVVKPQEKSFSFRSFYIVFAAALLVAIVVCLADVDHVIVVGLCFSLTMVAFVVCGLIFQVVCLQGSEKIQKKVFIALLIALFACAFLLAFSYTAVFIGEYFLTKTGQAVISGIMCLVIVIMSFISKGTVSAYRGPGLFARKPTSQKIVLDWTLASKSLARQKGLSEREEEVLLLIAQGFKNKNISEKLFISDNTVRAHIRNIYKKIEAHSKADVMKKLEEVLQEESA